MQGSDKCVELVMEAEGFRSKWYKCPAGKDTIAYGHVRRPEDTFDSCTPFEGRQLLVNDLKRYAASLEKCLRRVPTQNQFDAMLSMAYNTGVGVYDGVKGDLADSDLLMFFNGGYIAFAADEFLKWTKYRDPNDGQLKDLPGLVKRRTKERELFLGRL